MASLRNSSVGAMSSSQRPPGPPGLRGLTPHRKGTLIDRVLVIRDDQMRAIGQAMFQGWMRDHLRRYFPDQCSRMDQPALRRAISDGIAKAHSHGFVNEADCCRYVDMMFALGRNFDTDPALPWAADILSDFSITDPSTRIEMLHEAACEHLRAGAAETGNSVEARGGPR